MAKTILINPPFTLEDRYGSRMKSFGAISEPLGLAYIAASMLEHNQDVEILDAPAVNAGFEDVIEKVQSGGYTLIGITLLTPMFDSVKRLCKKLKEKNPKLKIIVGGPHPTALPERTLKEITQIDYLCYGEGETTMVELVRHLEGSGKLCDILGLAYRQGAEINVNPARPFESDLDSIPKPARHLLPMDHYRLTASRTKGSSYCPTLIVARGCPFDCQYCSHPSGRTFRHHSVERVISELKDLKLVYGIDQVNLEADTLTVDKGFIEKLSTQMVEQKLDLCWTCESRVDTIDEKSLKLMSAAGCWQISYGIESGSQRILELIHKGITKDQVRKAVKMAKDARITVRGFFMIGLPSESMEEALETIKFAKELDPMWAQFTVTIPYPGTPMFNQLESAGKIRNHEWSNYNTWGGWADKSLPFVPDGWSEQQMKEMQKKALRMFYMRPSVAYRFIKSISSISDLHKYITGAIVLVSTSINSLFRKVP